ncbi:hypothetical protein PFLG_02261 [Plasmodium falciparum RAJ116]|uniref:Uncharacterized protein n=1 Tax=Plasmodium falciparum RAJ116 TaxID=580058 RepID=A0A0L0D0D2_PLAFA|nr:hypothetical protein PFLG_02261 [Plasmodium falciparum RAJ116]
MMVLITYKYPYYIHNPLYYYILLNINSRIALLTSFKIVYDIEHSIRKEKTAYAYMRQRRMGTDTESDSINSAKTDTENGTGAAKYYALRKIQKIGTLEICPSMDHFLQNLDMDYNILYVIRRPDYLKDRRRDYLNNRRPDYFYNPHV